MKKNKFEISFEEVIGSLFFTNISFYASEILIKYNGSKHNNMSQTKLNESEECILNTFRILTSITNCLQSIEMSLLFVKRFYGKDYWNHHGFNTTDYYRYHYDFICHKVATLKDLNFKLINIVYDLKIKDRINWKKIEEHKSKIKNEQLFHLLDVYNNICKFHENNRHKSSHEGKVDLFTIEDYSTYQTLAEFKNKGYIPPLNEFSIFDVNSYQFQKIAQKSKKDTLKVFNSIKWNTYNLEKCIICSMFERLAFVCPDSIIQKYPDKQSYRNKCFNKFTCPHKNSFPCKIWLKANNLGQIE